jgi:hypothetical protein
MSHLCIGYGHERLGTPDRTRLEIRNGELVWSCRPCAEDEAPAPVVNASVCLSVPRPGARLSAAAEWEAEVAPTEGADFFVAARRAS